MTHNRLFRQYEEAEHKKEEKRHTIIDHADSSKMLSQMMEVINKVNDLENNISDYLHAAIGEVTPGKKTLLDKMADLEERVKVFTEHVNLLTTALNKLSGTQTGEKNNIQKLLNDIRSETEKRLSTIESHAIASQSTSSDIRKTVQSSLSFSNILFVVLFFVFQILIILGVFWYKKHQESLRKLL